MRCKFHQQASTAIQCQASSLRYTLSEGELFLKQEEQEDLRQLLLGAKRTLAGGKAIKEHGGEEYMGKNSFPSAPSAPSAPPAPSAPSALRALFLTLVVLLGLGGVGATTEVMAQSAPYPLAEQETQLNKPYTDRVALSLEPQPNETYETLMRRAEAAAGDAVRQIFEQDTQVTDASVTIVGQNQGAIAPVLSLEVNRTQWFSRPDVERWGTYFTSARSLLQFQDVATTTSTQPGTASPAAVPGQTTNSTPTQPGTANPAAAPGQTTNSTPTQPGTANPAAAPGQTTNSTDIEPGTDNPSAVPGQTTNSTDIEPGTDNPSAVPGQTTNSTPTQPETANPTTTPRQTQPSTGMNSQPPASAPVAPASNPLTPTSPNINPSSPSTSTPTSGTQNPSVPSTNGTTNNNPFPTPTTPNVTIPPGI